MLKKIKKIILFISIIQVLLGIFMGLLFLFDKMGKIDLEQFGIVVSNTGYGDGDIVTNMKLVHDYIREHKFGYAQLGKTLNESTFPTFLDCRNN